MDFAKPKLSKYLFWDCDYSKVDFDKNYKYVVEKVVTRGQINDFYEIQRYYSKEKIKDAITHIRSMPYKVLNFLSVVYDIPLENFRCYTKIQLNQRHLFY